MIKMNPVIFEKKFALDVSHFGSLVDLNTTRSSIRQVEQGFESVDSGIGGFVFHGNRPGLPAKHVDDEKDLFVTVVMFG